jgi:peptidase E
VREAVQGDVEDVAADALEVGGEAAELVVVLEEQHLAAELREVVRRGHPAEAGADDDGVVAREEVVERRGHCGSR